MVSCEHLSNWSWMYFPKRLLLLFLRVQALPTAREKCGYFHIKGYISDPSPFYPLFFCLKVTNGNNKSRSGLQFHCKSTEVFVFATDSDCYYKYLTTLQRNSGTRPKCSSSKLVQFKKLLWPITHLDTNTWVKRVQVKRIYIFL